MPESRVSVVGETIFNPREWLRREVLWASLMTPYSIQRAGWLDKGLTQRDQHTGNVSRQKIYNIEGDVEALSLSFFNQGKNIGGLISSVALFNAMMDKSGEGATVDLLEVQATSIDKVLRKTVSLPTGNPVEAETYQECAGIMKRVSGMAEGQFGKNQQLSKASRLMIDLASREASTWLEASTQNEEGNLPELTINNGGYPRSAGSRVDLLQPIFYSIVDSKPYAALNIV